MWAGYDWWSEDDEFYENDDRSSGLVLASFLQRTMPESPTV
jgi:hypothetical protein